jgi:type VI secretion system secreted protein Hcp
LLIEIKYADKGGILHPGGKGAIHGLKLGHETLTPKNAGFKIQSVSPRDVHTGLATGKRQHSPLLIIKEVDTSSPNLFEHCASGSQLIPKITFNFSNTDGKGTPQPFGTIVLTSAIVVSCTRGIIQPGKITLSSAPRKNILEEIKFIYQQIEWTYMNGNKMTDDSWSSTF